MGILYPPILGVDCKEKDTLKGGHSTVLVAAPLGGLPRSKVIWAAGGGGLTPPEVKWVARGGG